MKKAAKQLLTLAELRQAAAERGVAQAVQALKEAKDALDAAIGKLADLKARQDSARAALRSSFIEAPQAAVAVEELFESLERFDHCERLARDGIAQAEALREARRGELTKAQRALAQAIRNVEKRRLMLAPITAAALRRAETRDESDLEDRRFRGAA